MSEVRTVRLGRSLVLLHARTTVAEATRELLAIKCTLRSRCSSRRHHHHLLLLLLRHHLLRLSLHLLSRLLHWHLLHRHLLHRHLLHRHLLGLLSIHLHRHLSLLRHRWVAAHLLLSRGVARHNFEPFHVVLAEVLLRDMLFEFAHCEDSIDKEYECAGGHE
jgi:hypothetical protein